jgi:hypothetical protein
MLRQRFVALFTVTVRAGERIRCRVGRPVIDLYPVINSHEVPANQASLAQRAPCFDSLICQCADRSTDRSATWLSNK